MLIHHLALDQFRARPVTHMQPDSPEQWQDVDELHFQAIEAEIERRAAGGSPDDAPWSSARYFDAGPRRATTAAQVLVVLRHLSDHAVTQLLAMGQLLRHRLTDRKQPTVLEAPACIPAGNCGHTDHDLGLPARTRRKETPMSPPTAANVAEEPFFDAALTG